MESGKRREPGLSRLSLGKLGLQPGMTLLDVGCGWGATINRALEKYDVNVIGLTLSKNQKAHVEALLAKSPSTRSKTVQLRGWEEFDGKVDRIVSIGAFEHFGFDRYDDFFTFAYNALPDDGVMLLHTITILHAREMIEKGLPMTFEQARFIKFMVTEIFPSCRWPTIDMVHQRAGTSISDISTRTPPVDSRAMASKNVLASGVVAAKLAAPGNLAIAQ